MRLIQRTSAISIALVLIHLAVACATSDDAAPRTDDSDASTQDDASTQSDASSSLDAAGDAEASAPRECSRDGFCHTALPENQTLRAVWGDGQGVVWAISEQGAILRWDQTVWTIHASGLGKLTAIWGSAPTDLWVGGERGLFHGTGANVPALTFAPVTTPSGEVTSIWGLSPADVWAVVVHPEGASPRSSVLAYSPGDATWSVIPADLPETIRLSHVWGSAGAGTWLAGILLDPDTGLEPSYAYRRPPGSATFERVKLPAIAGSYGDLGKLASVSMISDSSMVLHGRTVIDEGILLRGTSTDNGQSFTFSAEVDLAFPNVYAIRAFAQDDLWAAGDYGRIRHWNGAEWVTVSLTVTKFPITSPIFGLWAKGPDDIWAVGDNVALHFDPAKKQ